MFSAEFFFQISRVSLPFAFFILLISYIRWSNKDALTNFETEMGVIFISYWILKQCIVIHFHVMCQFYETFVKNVTQLVS